MEYIEGGLGKVPGFKYAALECGIRYPDRIDYAVIVSDVMCNAAGVFTTNALAAAPVRLCREKIMYPVKAILVNSTNANACTGRQGYNNARFLTQDIAEKLGVHERSVLMCSTGIIGVQLPEEKMSASHDSLISSLSAQNGELVSKAIMTTDTVPKRRAVSFATSMGSFTLAGTAKGVGMIAPNMATLLAFFVTNAPIDKQALNSIFKQAAAATLNRITIDGDTSTNDSAIILSPVSDAPLESSADLDSFKDALLAVMENLSEQLVRDGEGATKFIRVLVKNAKDDDDAELIARKVSESVLVKTAFFGEDPNWGRVAMAMGNAGAEIREELLSISFGGCTFLERGVPKENSPEKIKEAMSQKDITVTIDCALGDGEALFMTSDLSYEYVKINAEYST
ncbi:MAG: bifunctional glutamate N-acetyltransferase/amino-acid acetyltransferase ArgJ [Leptospirales bacterium]|nr:bifunctional glutamate N-acetyltransferase/amino-acid acetyltransferase ArgJ [Leptospirales bacterium]